MRDQAPETGGVSRLEAGIADRGAEELAGVAREDDRCRHECALSRSARLLIAWRVLQGAGGGAVLPAGTIIWTSQAGKAQMARVMSLIGIPVVLEALQDGLEEFPGHGHGGEARPPAPRSFDRFAVFSADGKISESGGRVWDETRVGRTDGAGPC